MSTLGYRRGSPFRNRSLHARSRSHSRAASGGARRCLATHRRAAGGTFPIPDEYLTATRARTARRARSGPGRGVTSRTAALRVWTARSSRRCQISPGSLLGPGTGRPAFVSRVVKQG
jgi:hypothetical protein